MGQKIKAAIVGPGNIGIDLMCKLASSDVLELVKMMGIYEDSEGLRLARERGIAVSAKGIDFLTEDDGVDIVFDATSAGAHKKNAAVIQKLGKHAVDLTPAAIGPYVIPAVSQEHISLDTKNVNMVTCGGQATIPVVAAIGRAQPVLYGEIVATIASKSAGPGTRANIDEFTQTTARAIELIGGAGKGKAIIILNPAEPPLLMRDTIHATVENPNKDAITREVEAMVKTVQRYVPGYTLVMPPVFDGNKVSVMIQVEGMGDYLPKYAGNLDIMTCAAKAVGEKIGRLLLEKNKVPE
jgi:acetaldehyde dehydrogenase (acetylating)